LVGEYVWVTLYTEEEKLKVIHKGEEIKVFDYPLSSP